MMQILFSVAFAARATVSVPGACPGAVELIADGLTPNGQAELWLADAAGWELVPGGACAGAPAALGPGAARVATLRADAAGQVRLSTRLRQDQCGRLLQLVDTTTCELSTTARVASLPAWSTLLELGFAPLSLLPAADGGVDVLSGGDPLLELSPAAWWVHLSADGDPVWALAQPGWATWGAAVGVAAYDPLTGDPLADDRVAVAQRGADLVVSRMSAEGEERWTLAHEAMGAVVTREMAAAVVGAHVAVAAGPAWLVDDQGGVLWAKRLGGANAAALAVTTLASGDLLWSVSEPGVAYQDAGVRLTWTDTAGTLLRTVGFHAETSGGLRGMIETPAGELLVVGPVGNDSCGVARLSSAGAVLAEDAYDIAGRPFTCTGIVALPSGHYLVSGTIGVGDEGQLVLDSGGAAILAFTIGGSQGAVARPAAGGVFLATHDAAFGRPVVALLNHPTQGCAQAASFRSYDPRFSVYGRFTVAETLLTTSALLPSAPEELSPAAAAICP